MIILSDSVLVEFKSARNNQLERVSHDRASELLNKLKALYFAFWNGVGSSTNEQMAEFYEVSADAIESALRRHRDEFELDGLKTIKGRQLKAFKDVSALATAASKTSQLVIWTPRTALRLGMILRDSIIAQAVRSSLLDAVEQIIPAQSARIRELELELQVAQAQATAAQSQERLIQASSAIVTMHGAGMLGLILGKPDAIVEQPPTVIEKNILVNQAGKPLKTFEGLSKTKLAKRYGMKKPQDLVNWLQSMGKADLIQPGITTAPCQFVPFEYVAELDRLWAARQGCRQRILGE